MNIGLISDLAQTGFGRVGRELALRWLSAGHDLRAIGINFEGREGAVARAMRKKGVTGEDLKDAWDEVTADPVLSRSVPASLMNDGMGHNLTAPFVGGQLIKGWQPEQVVLVADPVAALFRLTHDEGALGRVPTYNYVPIEGSDLSAFWRQIWQHVQPVAMSRFGKQELDRVLGRDDTPYVPHGVSAAFRRITPTAPAVTPDGEEVRGKEDAKRVFGLEGRTVILRTDRFVERKDYPSYFEAIRRIVNERQEVVFVIHCSPVDEGGVMVQMLADLPGARYSEGNGGWTHSQVILTRAHDTFSGLSDDELNILVNAADIVASTSHSEGFGLGLAEAAACGVPVVATDFGAMAETVGPGGLLVPPWEIVPTAHGHHWANVDIDRFTDALMTLIDDPRLRDDLGAKGEAYSRRFDWDQAALAFLKIMEDDPRWQQR